MTSSRIGRGAIVTLGAAASMAWAAGAANACDNTPPKNPTPPTTDHHGHNTPPKTTPNEACTVQNGDVEYAEIGPNNTIVGGWHNAVKDTFQGNNPEPVYGYQVRLSGVDANCTGTVDVSLASYETAGPSWDSSGGPQTFVASSHVQLSAQSKTSETQTITVKLPGSPGDKNCFGQIDLYFGTTIYDGGTGKGHGPLPDHDHKPQPIATPDNLITAWNGGDAGGCAVVTSPPPVTTTTTPPTTSPTTHPSTTPTTPKTTTTTPATPATTTTPATPATPTLAHTGSNAGELSLVALAFFGAGGTAMFASRKAKAAGMGARKH